MSNQQTAERPKVFRLTEAQKALETGMSKSFLQKDRLKQNPTFEFRRYGRTIRYAEEE